MFNSNDGGRGESPEPFAAGAGTVSESHTVPVVNDAVSLAERFRRSLSGPQLVLFPEELAYESYRKYCSIVHVPPADFERWRHLSKTIPS